ncbi:MAG TPA: hypothetical protein VNZ58_13670, partial [Thermomicrobiales bacterium]|nr:hypothetical protein [Thermomicrobiales bacterium]
NHTAYHADLLDLPDDAFSREVIDPMISMDVMLGDIPGNQSRILTLPYGNSPDRDKHPDQRRMMREGIPYQGKTYHLAGALLVGADPAWSPASTQWDPFVVPRIQAFDESLDFWFGMFESGGVILYTSDGDPETIAIPQPLPPMLQGHLDVDALMAAGKTVIQYDPESGKTMFAVQVNMRSIAVVPVRNNPESGFGRYTAGEYSYPLSTIR